ncbi:MAG: hypothetical protein M1837_000253 [Sclerophora amabilis]|nr:MAG: hypothetical protein M1837_000253 [Sclerophora amabilis]
MSISNPPKALLFDVLGTVLDWQTSLTRGIHAITKEKLASTSAVALSPEVRHSASSLDDKKWEDFVLQWHQSYIDFTHGYQPKKDEWVNFTTHNLRSLKRLLAEWKLDGLFTEDELNEVTRLWNYLDPYRDSSKGIALLNQKFITSTLSNSDVSTLTDQAAHANLPWKTMTSSEHFAAYKPYPAVYHGAAAKLGVKPEECALVAAHLGDLQGAKACGYQAIYVERESQEKFKPEDVKKAKEEGWVDMWVSLGEEGFLTVADRFGIVRKSVDPDKP